MCSAGAKDFWEMHKISTHEYNHEHFIKTSCIFAAMWSITSMQWPWWEVTVDCLLLCFALIWPTWKTIGKHLKDFISVSLAAPDFMRIILYIGYENFSTPYSSFLFCTEAEYNIIRICVRSVRFYNNDTVNQLEHCRWQTVRGQKKSLKKHPGKVLVPL